MYTEAFKKNWKLFYETYHYIPYILGICVLWAYAVRAIQDNIFLDSEIMTLNPDYMHYTVWLGSNRFGLAFTSWLFGMHRLVPTISGVLMILSMWLSGIALAFFSSQWVGNNPRYKLFVCCFPALFITAPIFAEQFIFILQAFEIAFAIFLCILAVGFADLALCSDNIKKGYLVVAVICIVWSVGSYQAMAPLYIALVLSAFVLRYVNGSMKRTIYYGVQQACLFLFAILLYAIIATVIKTCMDDGSVYISSMIHWKTDGFRACLSSIKYDIKQVLTGNNYVYYSRYYTPLMVFFILQNLYYGWKKRQSIADYGLFLFGGGCLLVSPFFLTILTGHMQMARSQMVYPLTFALFLSSLTIYPELKSIKRASKIRAWTNKITMALTLVVVVIGCRQMNVTVQLLQTSSEAYRNDVLTANRIYWDICRYAQSENMSDTLVIFTGKRDAGLAGPAVRGELSGLSVFEAEAHTPAGVSGRVGNFCRTLGLEMEVLGAEKADEYQSAVLYMENAPSWPLDGSIQWMGDTIVVKLSNEWDY